ncbi:hypothetical protein FACS1894110_23170 [Spirochaetia bacterium]|nr:hypothetical protein FACS1894110_23170 [Spirochaetia bacterium]
MGNKIMGYAQTAHNIRYTLRRGSGLAYEKTQSGYALCAFFLRHIFAVAGNLRFPLSQPQKRRIAFTLYAMGAKLIGKRNGIKNLLENN